MTDLVVGNDLFSSHSKPGFFSRPATVHDSFSSKVLLSHSFRRLLQGNAASLTKLAGLLRQSQESESRSPQYISAQFNLRA